jgi:hypothetical protein
MADEAEKLIGVSSSSSEIKTYTGQKAIMAAWAVHGQGGVSWRTLLNYRNQGLQFNYVKKGAKEIPTCTDSAMRDFIYKRKMKKKK